MVRLIVLSGLSGSGKSTRAAEIVNDHPSYRIVSYDVQRIARPELSPGEVVAQLIDDAGYELFEGYSVIVDACNLHPHDRIRWETVAWATGVELEWVEIRTSLTECIRRDSLRQTPVGVEGILGQAGQ